MLPFELTKDTPYLALSGELWSVFYEYFNRNWPCYKGFLLYAEKFSLPAGSTYMMKQTYNLSFLVELFNSLAPGKFEWNFRYVIFKWI